MQVQIKIQTTNSAFEPNVEAEVSRIINGVGAAFAINNGLATEGPLYDSRGEWCGEVVIVGGAGS